MQDKKQQQQKKKQQAGRQAACSRVRATHEDGIIIF